MLPVIAQGLQSWSACMSGALDVKDYVAGLEAVGFVDVQATPKDDAANRALAAMPAGLPFSALITARKP